MLNISISNDSQYYTLSNTPKQISESLNCYMNSLLNCLYYIKELRDYLIENKNYFTKEQRVCKIISSIMYKLKYNASEYIKPEELQAIIGDKNNYIIGGIAGDSNCIFSSIIYLFLSELSRNNFREIDDNTDNISSVKCDSSNKKQVFQSLYNEIDKKNIINQIFLGYYETVYQCENNIFTNIYSIQNEYYINFNLEQIQKYYNNLENITITQCFEYYFRKKGYTKFYCSKCDTYEINNFEEKIYKPPLILVIVLNKGNVFDEFFIPDEILDLSKYIDENEYKNEGHFKLISYSAQYSACCMTDDNDTYYYNKTVTKNITESEMKSDEPLLLFYRQYYW